MKNSSFLKPSLGIILDIFVFFLCVFLSNCSDKKDIDKQEVLVDTILSKHIDSVRYDIKYDNNNVDRAASEIMYYNLYNNTGFLSDYFIVNPLDKNPFLSEGFTYSYYTYTYDFVYFSNYKVILGIHPGVPFSSKYDTIIIVRNIDGKTVLLKNDYALKKDSYDLSTKNSNKIKQKILSLKVIKNVHHENR